MIRTLRFCFASAAVFGLAALLVGAAAAPSSPFVKVVMKNWSAWDRNHDKRLSPEEIDDIVLNPAMRGDDAAAAGTLKLMARNPSMEGVALTQEYFQAYDRGRKAGAKEPEREDAEWSAALALKHDEETGGGKKGNTPNWDLLFSAGRSRIASGTDGWTGRFVLEHMRQGPLGDCFFISSLGSLLSERPEKVKELITHLSNGSYRVAFPDGAKLSIRQPTESELAISSVSAGDGCWLAAMEQGYSQYALDKKGKEPADEGEATDAISGGGVTKVVISALTSHTTKSMKIEATVEGRKANAAKFLPELRSELQATLGAHRVMTVSVAAAPDADGKAKAGKGKLPATPPGINHRHAYAILAYDRKSDEITIWNPHGQMFQPKGKPGLANGYVTEHGRFHLPLTEAYTFFSNFTFETGDPIKPVLPAKLGSKK